jgi:WD40 repeat protein
MNLTRSSAIEIHLMAALICISWCGLAYAQELKPRAVLEGHKDGVISLAFSPDGKTLASGSWDDTIRLWDVATGKSTATLQDASPNSLHFSPDGKTLAIAYGTASILWDVSNRKSRVLKDEEWLHQCIRFMGCFSPDGKILATGGYCFPEIGLWDVKTGKLLRILEENTVEGHRLFMDTRITPDGKTLLAYGSLVGLRKWEIATGKSLPVVELPIPLRADITKTPDGRAAAISPDCKLLAVSIPAAHAEKDGQLVVKSPPYIAILDVATGKPTTTFRGLSEIAGHLAFSCDGKTLAAGFDSESTLWDIATGREIASFKTTDDGIHSMALSPDGKTLAIGYDKKTIRLWDVPAKK